MQWNQILPLMKSSHSGHMEWSRETDLWCMLMPVSAVIFLEWPLMIRSPEMHDVTRPQGRHIVSILVHRASAVKKPPDHNTTGTWAEMWNRLWTLCIQSSGALQRSIRGRSLSLSQSQAGGGTERAVWTRVTQGQQGRPSHSQSWTSSTVMSESTAHICWRHDWQTLIMMLSLKKDDLEKYEHMKTRELQNSTVFQYTGVQFGRISMFIILNIF